MAFNWLPHFGRKRKQLSSQAAVVRSSSSQRLHARYDAAQTTPDNAVAWAMADSLSADAAGSSSVRQLLRNRARYEAANNSYARGLVNTLANDCIGSGPRLQLLTDDDALNREVERWWSDWVDSVDLAGKLRTMRMSKVIDGEAFAMPFHNRGRADLDVPLDVMLIEAEQVHTPYLLYGEENRVDGLVFDEYGNLAQYHVLRHHPGSDVWTSPADLDVETIPANRIIHWFRVDRPGQHRGISEITPALPLFMQLRRYTLAVLTAAETAADFAALIYTDAPADDGNDAESVETFDIFNLEKGKGMVLPYGWKISQLKAEQPSTSYPEFKHEILNEIARCMSVPYNIAAGNSSGYNYASGRLDHQTYCKSIRIEQANCAQIVLDPLFRIWIEHAMLRSELSGLRRVSALPHQWFWDGTEHVDPAKEASAQATRLASNTTTLAIEFARQGRDWEAELHQRAKELDLMNKLGLAAAESVPSEEAEMGVGDVEE